MEKDSKAWRKLNFEKIKREVREELDAVAPSGADGERMNHALKRIFECQKENQEDSPVRQYVFIVSALLEHGRHGILNPRAVGNLFKLADRVLKLHGLRMKSERHSHLFADLFLLRSQIHRVGGNLEEALWEEHISNSLSLRAPPERLAFQRLSTGIHLLRMGYAGLAIEEFTQADAHLLETQQRYRLFMEFHMALRLAGQIGLAKQYASEHDETFKKADKWHQVEWQWEKLCRECQSTGSIEELMRAIRGNPDFKRTSYAIEAFLFARVIKQKDWMERVNQLPSIKDLPTADRQHYDTLHKAAKAIKFGYSPEGEYIEKLQSMTPAFSRLNEIRSVFHELLVRAALVRWFYRLRTTGVVASISIVEYQNLSLKLTGGGQTDALALLGDIPTLFDLNRNVVQEAA